MTRAQQEFLLDPKFGFLITLLFCDIFRELWLYIFDSVAWEKLVSWFSSGKLYRPPKKDGLNLPYHLLQAVLKLQKRSNW